ncbi:unnamed protein product [Somion occarium]
MHGVNTLLPDAPFSEQSVACGNTTLIPQDTAQLKHHHSGSNQTPQDPLVKTTGHTTPLETAPKTSKASYISLPSELLLEIFRYATYVPRSRALTPSDPFAPETPHNFAWHVNTPVLSMRTKCVLVLVCKEWRMLATELLYEHVVINSQRKANLVYRSLCSNTGNIVPGARVDKGNALEEDDFPRGHGRWVRHLEVYVSIRASGKRSFLTSIALIASKCLNLQVFSGAWIHTPPKEFLNVIFERHKKTLQGFSWTQPTYSFSLSGETNNSFCNPGLLDILENLKILDLRVFAKHALPMDAVERDDDKEQALIQATPVVSQPKMTLPYVSTLCIAPAPALLAFLSTVSLPALHTLIIDSSSSSSDVGEINPPAISTSETSPLTYTLLQFLAAHGSSITSLELIPPTSKQHLSSDDATAISSVKGAYVPSPFPISPGFFLQPGVCPNLQSLVYDCRERCMVFPVAFDFAVSPEKQYYLRESDTPTPPDLLTSRPSTPVAVAPDTVLPIPIPSKPTLMSHSHTSLRQIGIRGLEVSHLYPSKPCHSQTHLVALLNLREGGTDLLPSLRKVQTIGFLVEGSTDFNTKDIVIWWMERFDEANMDLLDGEGVLWLYDDY